MARIMERSFLSIVHFFTRYPPTPTSAAGSVDGTSVAGSVDGDAHAQVLLLPFSSSRIGPGTGNGSGEIIDVLEKKNACCHFQGPLFTFVLALLAYGGGAMAGVLTDSKDLCRRIKDLCRRPPVPVTDVNHRDLELGRQGYGRIFALPEST